MRNSAPMKVDTRHQTDADNEIRKGSGHSMLVAGEINYQLLYDYYSARDYCCSHMKMKQISSMPDSSVAQKSIVYTIRHRWRSWKQMPRKICSRRDKNCFHSFVCIHAPGHPMPDTLTFYFVYELFFFATRAMVWIRHQTQLAAFFNATHKKRLERYVCLWYICKSIHGIDLNI